MPKLGSEAAGTASLPPTRPAAPTRFAGRLAGFNEHWRALEPELRRIETKRFRSLAHAILLAVLGVSGIAVGLNVIDPRLSNGERISDVLTPIATCVGLFILCLAFQTADRQSRVAGRLIKTRVFRIFGLGYQENASRFPIDSFDRNGLLPEHTKRRLEDLVFGEVCGVPIVFCDARLRTTESRLKGARTVTIFHGPLMLSRFPKRARGRTIVVPDGGAAGNFFREMNEVDRQRVKLESPEFEREFAVYSTDQVEARYLLTPMLMERLVALKKRFPGRLTVAFDGHEFLLALDDGRDWFPDPGPFQDLTDPLLVREQAEEIARLAEIVETLRLNVETRV